MSSIPVNKENIVDDPFKFKKKSFNRRNKANESFDDDDDDSSSSDEDDLPKRKATLKLKSLSDEENNIDVSDDDSDVEITVTKKLKKTEPTIDCLNSSDDSDDGGCRPGLRKYPYQMYQQNSCAGNSKNSEAMMLLHQSRQSKQKLKQAQLYKAEDVRVVCENKVIKPAERMNLLGNNLHLTLRITQVINGEWQHSAAPREVVQTIRKLEPMQKMLDRFIQSESIPENQKVSFMFDGVVMDTTKTPASFELSDGDSIDVEIHKKVAKKAIPMIKLMFRSSKESSDEMRVGKTHKFGVEIMDQYRQLKKLSKRKKIQFMLDGDAIGANTTPEDEDLDGGEIIEVQL